jgi:hypothetical protein
MFVDYPLPSKGKHKMGIRLYKTERSVFSIGVIAQHVRKFVHSSTLRDYFVYKVNKCELVANVEGLSERRVRTKCQFLL